MSLDVQSPTASQVSVSAMSGAWAGGGAAAAASPTAESQVGRVGGRGGGLGGRRARWRIGTRFAQPASLCLPAASLPALSQAAHC